VLEENHHIDTRNESRGTIYFNRCTTSSRHLKKRVGVSLVTFLRRWRINRRHGVNVMLIVPGRNRPKRMAYVPEVCSQVVSGVVGLYGEEGRQDLRDRFEQ
jgi:hypothetical protein